MGTHDLSQNLPRLPAIAGLLALGLVAALFAPPLQADQPGERLTSRPPTAHTLPAVAVGEEVRTAAGERRCLRLPDGSVLYVNADSRVKIEAERRIQLGAGEIFVEVAAK